MAKSEFPIAEAKRIDMVDYLASLGFYPQRIVHQNYWYLSPLRQENTPSFKIDRNLNLFYDFGIGRGGSIIDFGMMLHQCTISQVIEKLQAYLSFYRLPTYQDLQVASRPKFPNEEKKIRVISTGPITSSALLHYLDGRCISWELAGRFCREVHYSLYRKNYYAIGFMNDAGGFELRNPYFKGSSSPKAATFMDNGASEVSVFEGFFSFLSFLAIHEGKELPVTNYLVLNSLSLFNRSREIMEQHQAIDLYLDRDKAGIAQTNQALKLDRRYQDCSQICGNNKDLNQFLIHSNLNKISRYLQDSPGRMRPRR